MRVILFLCGIVLGLVALFAGGCALIIAISGAGNGYGIWDFGMKAFFLALASGLASWLFLRGAQRDD